MDAICKLSMLLLIYKYNKQQKPDMHVNNALSKTKITSKIVNGVADYSQWICTQQNVCCQNTLFPSFSHNILKHIHTRTHLLLHLAARFHIKSLYF